MNTYEFTGLTPEERVILLDVSHNTVLRQCLNRAKEDVKQRVLDLNPTSFNDSDLKSQFILLKERRIVLDEFQDFLDIIREDFKLKHSD